ncbi:hypothetical protein MASR2M78_00960 [Treponema sp.]
MQAELTEQLRLRKARSGKKTYRKSSERNVKKKLRSDQESMEIEVPRDRDGAFEPIIVPGINASSRALMTEYYPCTPVGPQREIAGHLKEIYGTEDFTGLISRAWTQ